MADLVNYTAYKTSKSEEAVQLNGQFDIDGKVLNGRLKIVEHNTGNVFWVEVDPTLVEHVSVEEVRFQVDNSTTETASSPVIKEPSIYHTVRRGDTVQSIAQQYGIPVSTIINRNGSATVTLGQRIFIK